MVLEGTLDPTTTITSSLRTFAYIYDVDLTDFPAGYDSAVFSSPAVGVYDLHAGGSSNSSHVGTVSPHDLFLHDSFMSAPNSTALTSLTSPSDYNESPYVDSYDVSPNFGTGDAEAVSGQDAAWFPLFDQINNAVAGAAAADDKISPESDFADLSEDKVDSSSRRGSGHTRSASSSTKHSSVSGVNSRRRDKPLAPIVVEDPSDTVAMKRARNTLAARKSRQRKQERLEELEEVIAKLTAERDHWKKVALNQ
ncbi:cross-pathway control protein 1 [Grosmannia clavigera kw1407]|uniref:Cross-pathway control protein 1 n=1 Tax=Grosmannia clavigera (strain kw1407 / UAMH 11150) TaxID=655863 RepID=F0XMK2_GROCL|nr:cross-pathway control protein 1 [Grosmannia clavigera kw1407]EFX01315.1 cross-pathway control protein 1 [Grosmannia clavigera kw1407]